MMEVQKADLALLVEWKLYLAATWVSGEQIHSAYFHKKLRLSWYIHNHRTCSSTGPCNTELEIIDGLNLPAKTEPVEILAVCRPERLNYTTFQTL